MEKETTYLVDMLYPTVVESLEKTENRRVFSNIIDRFMADNIDRLNIPGPLKYVSFPQRSMDQVVDCMGLTNNRIVEVTKQVRASHPKLQSVFGIALNPFFISVALATRYFLMLRKDASKSRNPNAMRTNEDMISRCVYYLAITIYAVLQKKYFRKCEPNDAVMAYAISNMIKKNRIKQTGSMLDTVYITTNDCLTFYGDRLRKGDDDSVTQYIAAIRTRLNSIIQNISRAYYEAYKNRDFLASEEDNLELGQEADSNSQFIERTTNKIVQIIITNGPDMKLVEISAKQNNVSMSELRNYMTTICTQRQMNGIREIVERLLILFFDTELNNRYTVRDIGTDKFLLFALDTYKKSNTGNENIIKIKAVLDKWLKELGVSDRTGPTSLNNYRRAIYMFLVMEIIKLTK